MSLALAFLPVYTKKPSCFSLCNPRSAFSGSSLTCFPSMKPRKFNIITSQIQPAEATSDEQVLRKNPNFAPTVWGDHFIGFQPNTLELESHEREVNVLKEEVKEMLMASTSNPTQNVHLIDLLCRLGLDYHYEIEIELQLHHLYYGPDNIFRDNNYDLDTMSRLFRLCRQYGYDISSVVFNKFLDNHGKFKADLGDDTKGMLSLYEASHVSINGEDVLDEALAFTTAHLKSLVSKPIKKHLAQHIQNALAYPFHKSLHREEAKKYVFFYENEDFPNDKILRFAKFDMNRLLLIYQQELNDVSSWWKETNLLKEYPFKRDRIVELHAWATITTFEPCYGRSRIIYTETNALLSLIDDLFDSYATPQEIQLFAEAIRRWDISAIDTLPDYLHSLYRRILNLWDEVDKETINAGRPYCNRALRNLYIEVCDGYEVEAQWAQRGYVPTLNEYLRTATITSGLQAITASCFQGMQSAKEEALEWVQSYCKIIHAANVHGRIANDLVSYKREQRTGQHASSIECYMKQYGISEEIATEELKQKMVIQWKIVNEEFFRPTPIPYHLMTRIVHAVRLCEAWYKMKDSYTEPEYCKDSIRFMFVDKIPI